MAKKIFCFSVDDGNIEDKIITKKLNEYGFKATFNLNSDLFGYCHPIFQHETEIQHNRLTKHEAKELYTGHDINCHTLSHKKLINCSDDEVAESVEKDRVALSELFDREITGLAYPGGAPNHNERNIEIIKKQTGIKFARSLLSEKVSFLPPEDFYEWNFTCHLFSPKLIGLIDEYKKEPTDTDKVFVLFFHGYNFQISGEKYGLPIENTYEWFDMVLKKLAVCDFDFMTMTEAYRFLNR